MLSRIASPGGQRGSLTVLFFHRVLAAPDPMAPWEPTAERFDAVVRWIKSQFAVVDLGDAVEHLRQGTLPPAAAAITFDDGYRDNWAVALPVLQRHGVPATVFVASAYLNGGIMWNDVAMEAIRRTSRERLSAEHLGLARFPLGDWSQRRAAFEAIVGRLKYLDPAARNAAAQALANDAGVDVPRDLMMTTAQLCQLAVAGVRIGAHTDSHPILALLEDGDAEREMAAGRRRLESLVDTHVGLFAYPNGQWRQDYDARHVEMARRLGFDAAFSTEPGVCRGASDAHNLPRFTPWDRQRWRFQARLALNLVR